MTPTHEWEPITGLPDTLEKLLKETEINNSYRDSDVTDVLKDTMESSYSFLYRTQKDSVNYSRHHFQTREYLLNTTYNDIQKGLKHNYHLLREMMKSENPDPDEIAKIKRTIAEFGEVRFGDLYLDHRRRVCVNIEHDIIKPEVREIFRNSEYYRKHTSLATVLEQKKLFRQIPIAFMDGQVRTDISVFPLEQGTKIVFNHMTARDLYNTIESQIFHDVCVMFIPNTNIEFSTLSKDAVQEGLIPVTKYDMKDGTYFVVIRGDKKASHLIPVVNKEDGIFIINIDSRAQEVIDSTTTETMDVSIIFFQNLYKYEFSISGDGSLPTQLKGRITDDGSKYIETPESRFFIPMIDNSILPMPVPEDNVLVMKSMYNGTVIDRYEPVYHVGVTLHYPNMYQVSDSNLTLEDRYLIYFFYKEENDIRYTPLFDFYWKYLSSRFNNLYTIEDVVNKLYFKDDGWEKNLFLDKYASGLSSEEAAKKELEGELIDVFYTLFEKIIEYKDYKYYYGTPDFIDNYVGDDIPRQYKIARMMEFIKADWEVLPTYVKQERRKEVLFHFFTNTINLAGRFRRSTRLEDRENNHFMFADGCKITDSTNPNAYMVVDEKGYDTKYEVYIDDVKLLLPSVQVGDYVEFTNLTDRYVFAFRNHGEDILRMKVFIDGLLCSDVITVNSLGMDYLYVPTSMVNENSYIMMELEWDMDDPLIEIMKFENSDEWKSFHIVEVEHLEYTMNDITIKLNGETLKPEMYSLQLLRNNVPYSMYDENHEVENKYGIVTDVNIQLTNITEFPAEVEVIVNKTSYVAFSAATRNGYPRFDLSKIKVKHDISRARLYYNGRLTPSNTFRYVNSQGREYMQSRIFCERGDQYYFEYSPYSKELVCDVVEFNPNELFDFSPYGDKPLDPTYYEVYVNGRRLGLPNLFPFGPHHSVFKGVKSKHLLSIYEKERDFEYFGYSKVFQGGETFYYLTIPDLINSGFVTDLEAEVIIDEYIKTIKHKDAIILPNELIEEPITYDIETGLIEEMKIFFFEELLPLGLGNPDELQFNKAYFSEVFPSFTKEFMIEVGNGDPVIFLDPDVTARIYDPDTNDYEIIDTSDADPAKAFVMVTGEASY